MDIRLQDYRDLNEQFDRIVSVGMFEHVGPKNYDTYFSVVDRNLKPDGIFLLHTIGSKRTDNNVDPWINKYIFPNGCLPSVRQIANASEPHFIMEDWHNFGADYDTTLMAWHSRFREARQKLRTTILNGLNGCSVIISMPAQAPFARVIFNFGRLFSAEG